VGGCGPTAYGLDLDEDERCEEGGQGRLIGFGLGG